MQKECVSGHLSNAMLHKLNCRYYYVNTYVQLQTQGDKIKRKSYHRR